MTLKIGIGLIRDGRTSARKTDESDEADGSREAKEGGEWPRYQGTVKVKRRERDDDADSRFARLAETNVRPIAHARVEFICTADLTEEPRNNRIRMGEGGGWKVSGVVVSGAVRTEQECPALVGDGIVDRDAAPINNYGHTAFATWPQDLPPGRTSSAYERI